MLRKLHSVKEIGFVVFAFVVDKSGSREVYFCVITNAASAGTFFYGATVSCDLSILEMHVSK